MDIRGGFQLRAYGLGPDGMFPSEHEAIREARRRLKGRKQTAYAEVLTDCAMTTWQGWVDKDGAVVELYKREPGCDDDLPPPERRA